MATRRQTTTERLVLFEATRRRLEARIGELIGPAERGGDRGNQHTGGKSLASETPDDLTPNGIGHDQSADELNPRQRHDFRKLADHPEIVDEVIDASDDDSPPSRRKVLDEIGRRRL